MSKTRSFALIGFVAAITGTAGCKKSTDDQPSRAAITRPTEPQQPAAAVVTPAVEEKQPPVAADPKPVVVPASCTEGRFGGGDVPFCLALPPGYTVTEKPAKADAGWWGAEIAKDHGGKLVLKWITGPRFVPKEMFDLYLGDNRKEKGFVEGEISGGRGHFVEFSDGSASGIATVALSSDSKLLARCDVYPGHDPAPEALEACKTLTTF